MARDLQQSAIDMQTKLSAEGIMKDIVRLIEALNSDRPNRSRIREQTATTASKIDKIAS